MFFVLQYRIFSLNKHVFVSSFFASLIDKKRERIFKIDF
jgi:hypothetical protein